MNNSLWVFDDSKILPAQIHGDRLEVQISHNKNNLRNFKFKLHSKVLDFFYFRFDSIGPSHYNADPNVPLELKKVPTPHFQTYDNNGIPVAYQTSVLKGQQRAMEDIELAFHHFCSESNIKTASNQPATIQFQSTLHPLPDDPLKGASF